MEEFEYVKNHSQYVTVNEEAISDFIEKLGNIHYVHWSEDLNLNLKEEQWILLVFIIESMNFCFWQKPKWKIEYKNQIFSGLNALFFSVISEIEKNNQFLNIDYLKELDKNNFSQILKGIEGEVPLLNERYDNLKETIHFISKNNHFYDELFQINSDLELLNYIVTNLNSFNDCSIYKDKVIHFYKRATLLTNDLFHVSKKINQNIKDVSHLYGCADYSIPRTFRDYELLIYSNELAHLVDNEIEIEHDSDYEIEIRACMVYVMECIKSELHKRGNRIHSIELDNCIWTMTKTRKDKGTHHCTRTIYY